jgi:hypothetical protein
MLAHCLFPPVGYTQCKLRYLSACASVLIWGDGEVHSKYNWAMLHTAIYHRSPRCSVIPLSVLPMPKRRQAIRCARICSSRLPTLRPSSIEDPIPQIIKPAQPVGRSFSFGSGMHVRSVHWGAVQRSVKIRESGGHSCFGGFFVLWKTLQVQQSGTQGACSFVAPKKGVSAKIVHSGSDLCPAELCSRRGLSDPLACPTARREESEPADVTQTFSVIASCILTRRFGELRKADIFTASWQQLELFQVHPTKHDSAEGPAP